MEIKQLTFRVKKVFLKVLSLVVLAAVLGLGVYQFSQKADVLVFAFTHTEETRYAANRYDDVQKAAKEMYKQAFSAPLKAEE